MRSLVVVVLLSWIAYAIFLTGAVVSLPRSVHVVVFAFLVSALAVVWIGPAPRGKAGPLTNFVNRLRAFVSRSTGQRR
jgi:hypothetical protein